MPVTGSDLINSRKQGMAGFAARGNITDDLITQALERDRSLKAGIEAAGNKTALAATKTKASADLRIAQLGNQARIQQERMQQEGLTARQRITEAGNIALQSLQGNQNLIRVGKVGEEERKTNQANIDYQIKVAREQGLLSSGQEVSGSSKPLVSDEMFSSRGKKVKGLTSSLVATPSSSYVYQPSTGISLPGIKTTDEEEEDTLTIE